MKCDCQKPFKPYVALHPFFMWDFLQFEDVGEFDYDLNKKVTCKEETGFYEAIVQNYPQAKSEYQAAGCLTNPEKVTLACKKNEAGEYVVLDSTGSSECNIAKPQG